MVNVAGRSKACHTCKKRRIACSQERPQCSQCIKYGQACPGYQRDRVFIHFGDKPSDGQSPPRVKKSQTSPDRSTSPSLAKSNRQLVASDWFVDPGRVPRLDLVYRQQLSSNFADAIRPSHDHLWIAEGPWMALWPDLRSPSTALEISLSAIWLANLGRENADADLVARSLTCYNRGLHELQMSLRDPKAMLLDDTLAAASALALYEAAECPSNETSGFLSHQRGLATLVKMRGPAGYASPLSRRVFYMFRTVEALHAMTWKEGTFLLDKDWSGLPWEGTTKSVHQHVLDIFIAISGLLQKAEAVSFLPRASQAKSSHTLAMRYWSLDAQLEDLSEGLVRAQSEHMFWSVPSELNGTGVDNTSPELFPTVYEFASAQIAVTILLYWTTKVMIHASLTYTYNYLHNDLARTEEPDAQRVCALLPSLDGREDWGKPLAEACRSVEYFLKKPVTSGVGLSAAAPLSVLVHYVKQDTRYYREYVWLQERMERLSTRGARLLKHPQN